jgi:hypothetical protein
MTKRCPILKKLGLKLEKHLAVDNSNDLAAQVALEGSTPLPAPAPSPTPATEYGGGLASIPGACTTSTEEEMYNSGDEFSYDGKYEGVLFDPSLNNKKTTSAYPTATHSCSCRTTEIQPSANSICPYPSGFKTVSLPKHIMALLDKPPAHSISSTIADRYPPRTGLLVANTEATDHMIHNKSTFISY